MTVQSPMTGSTMDRRLRPFALGLALLDRGVAWVVIAMMAVMVTIVSAQVFLRYVLNSSIGWADEVSRLAFIWAIFLAIPLGVKVGAHIGIEMLTSRLRPRLQETLERAIAAVCVGLMLLVCYQAAVITIEQWDEKMASLELSAALFILAVAIGAAHSALHLFWIVLTGRPRSATMATE